MEYLEIILGEVASISWLACIIVTRRKDRMPTTTIVLMLLLGIIITIPIVLIENAVIFSAGGAFSFSQGLCIGLIEEGFKGILTLAFLVPAYRRSRSRFYPYDGLLYGVIPSVSYAFVENFFYITGKMKAAGWIRAIAGCGHMTYGAVIGVFFVLGLDAIERGDKAEGLRRALGGFALAVFLHGLFDTDYSLAGSIPVISVSALPLNSIMSLSPIIGLYAYMAIKITFILEVVLGGIWLAVHLYKARNRGEQWERLALRRRVF